MPLADWQNFYVIVGSSAGALTGLQFVVMTLLAQAEKAGSMTEVRAFGTPTVIHFCTALVVSAVMSAPWRSLAAMSGCLAVFGGAGVIYSISVMWHAHKAEYNPDASDWIWYTGCPLLAHLGLAGAAVMLWEHATWPLFAVAGISLLFLLLGVRNSWDTVTYIAVHRKQPRDAEPKE